VRRAARSLPARSIALTISSWSPVLSLAVGHRQLKGVVVPVTRSFPSTNSSILSTTLALSATSTTTVRLPSAWTLLAPTCPTS